MLTSTDNIWRKQRFYVGNEKVGTGKYAAQCDWVQLTPEVHYVTGLIHKESRRITPQEYQQAFKESGVDEMMYYRPDDLPLFGGEQVYVLRDGVYTRIPGLYLRRIKP